MLIEINGEKINVPSDLSNISLGKFIEWYETYGRNLDDKLGDIYEKKYDDELQQAFAIEDHLFEEAIAWYSFFTGFDFSTIKELPIAPQLLNQYCILRELLNQSENETQAGMVEVDWNGEEWAIQDWRVDAKSTMSFNEIITSKETIRQISQIGLGKWDALIYLSAIFFRKKGEPFTDELIFEDGERIELMKSLPMNYAMMVAFFLKNCVNTWKNTFQSSAQKAPEKSHN